MSVDNRQDKVYDLEPKKNCINPSSICLFNTLLNPSKLAVLHIMQLSECQILSAYKTNIHCSKHVSTYDLMNFRPEGLLGCACPSLCHFLWKSLKISSLKAIFNIVQKEAVSASKIKIWSKMLFGKAKNSHEA